MFWYPPFQNHQFVCRLHEQNFPMNYPPIYLCDTLAFNLNELIMQDFANAVETVSKMKDLSSCRVFLVNSAAFHKYERHCHTFIFFHVEVSQSWSLWSRPHLLKTTLAIQRTFLFNRQNVFPPSTFLLLFLLREKTNGPKNLPQIKTNDCHRTLNKAFWLSSRKWC